MAFALNPAGPTILCSICFRPCNCTVLASITLPYRTGSCWDLTNVEGSLSDVGVDQPDPKVQVSPCEDQSLIHTIAPLGLCRSFRADENRVMPKSVPRAQTLSLGHSRTNSRPMPAESKPSSNTSPAIVAFELAPAASSMIPFTNTITPANRVRLISPSMGSIRMNSAPPM